MRVPQIYLSIKLIICISRNNDFSSSKHTVFFVFLLNCNKLFLSWPIFYQYLRLHWFGQHDWTIVGSNNQTIWSQSSKAACDVRRVILRFLFSCGGLCARLFARFKFGLSIDHLVVFLFYLSTEFTLPSPSLRRIKSLNAIMLLDIVSTYRNTITINCLQCSHLPINLVQSRLHPVMLGYSDIPSLGSYLLGGVSKLFVFLFQSLWNIVQILAVDDHVSTWGRSWQHWLVAMVTFFSVVASVVVFYYAVESVGILNYLLEGGWNVLFQWLWF